MGGQLVASFFWPEDKSLVDAFPAKLGIKEITGLLCSVGFSSPPAWQRPFRCLSNGEQFRATLARSLAEGGPLVVFDEFTSVVDRQVAQIGSAAVAKAVRARGQQFIAVTCHYDVEEWLQPDWHFDPSSGEFAWRSLQRRPEIRLEVVRTGAKAWQLFRRHHYLSESLACASKCFVGLVDEQPATFTAVVHFPHAIRPGWREHRTVCLPDFQGVGLGNAMSELIAGIFAATGKPYRSVTSHPAMIRHRAKSPLWKMTRAPSLGQTQKTGSLDRFGSGSQARMNATAAIDRCTATFEYVGPSLLEHARGFGLL